VGGEQPEETAASLPAEVSEEETAGGEPRGKPWLAALLAWLLPGAGHVYLGRWLRGAVFCALVLSLVFAGASLDGRLWRPEGNPLASGSAALAALLSLLSAGLGSPYLALLASGYRGQVASFGYEYGTAFLLTAALMNLLLVFDALDVSRGRKP